MIPSTSVLANFTGTGGGGGGGGARVSISNQNPYSAPGGTAAYKVRNTGTIADQNGNLETWLLSGVASDYDVRATFVSGNAPTGSSTGVWISCGTGAEWDENASLGQIRSCTLAIEIRDAVTLTVLDAATVNITSDNS